MKLNDHDVDKLREQWNNSSKLNGGYKFVQINNYLEEETANTFLEFIEQMPENWWKVTVRADGYHPTEPYGIGVYNKSEVDKIKVGVKAAKNNFLRHQHSYWFDATLDDHYDECTCQECQFREWAISDTNIDLIRSITGLSLKNEFSNLFLSRYREGQFFSPHTDEDKGRVCFILNFTKNWAPEWGGNTHLLSNDWKRHIHVGVPTFNTLQLVEIADGSPVHPSKHHTYGFAHYVSHVVPGVVGSRYAFTGWIIERGGRHNPNALKYERYSKLGKLPEFREMRSNREE